MKRIHHRFGRFAYMLIYIMRYVLPFSRKPRTRVLAILNDSEVLLVKNWLSSQKWSLPGGGIKRNETPARSAARELYEETGLQVAPSQLTFLGHMPNSELVPIVMVYKVHLNDSDSAASIPSHARHEIIDLAWHRITQLPPDRTPLVDHVLAGPEQQG